MVEKTLVFEGEDYNTPIYQNDKLRVSIKEAVKSPIDGMVYELFCCSVRTNRISGQKAMDIQKRVFSYSEEYGFDSITGRMENMSLPLNEVFSEFLKIK